VRLDEKAALDPTVRLQGFVEVAAEVGVSPDELPVRLGVAPGEVARVIKSAADVVPTSTRLLAPRVIDAARDATLGALAEYHQKKPLDPGMPRELLRQVVRDESLAEYVQQSLNEAGMLAIEGQTVRTAGHRPVLTDEQAEAGRRALAELKTAAALGKTVTELEDTLRGSAGRSLLEFYVRQGAIVRVGKDRYYDKAALDQIMLRILQEIDRLGRASPGQLRAKTELSRKYLIPLLEWMDVRSLTQRDGDTRGLGPAAVQVLNQVDSS
jgi:selenocysteine-specific elongation factor